MAAGDVVTSSYNSTTTGGYTVQPAVGVNIMITAFWGTAGYINWKPTNSSGSSAMAMAGTNGRTSETPAADSFGGNLKLFFTNSEYFQLYSVSGTQQSGYSGIEI